ncbi:hypothetical protein K501DRAFT_334806 [Backusella circina FSU 941]|nr:hypothetical protein K501DRAFT_334806 [Backusella circina FSU 941]
MIEKLPLEVFETLYSLLHRKDLIQCQCVSQEWYQRWVKLIYRNIHTLGEKQLKRLLNHSYPFSMRGQQVRKLVIEKGHVQPELLGSLPVLFPYIESFMFDGVVLCEAAREKTLHHYQQREQHKEIAKIRHCFKTWAQHLRQLVEFNGITVTQCILTENYCPHLTRLSLQFNNTNDLTNSKTYLLRAFKNAPLLTYLSLERIFLDVDELELIHHHCQNLESLRLKGTVFLPMRKGYAETVPAPHFRTLECFDSSFYDHSTVDWLRYIATKYCHAESLDIGCFTFDNNEDWNDCLISLASKCTRLCRLNISSFPLTKAFLDVLGKQGTCLKQITIGDGVEYNLQDKLKALIDSRQTNCISDLIIHAGPTTLTSSGFESILKTIHGCPFLTSLALDMGSIQEQYQKWITGSNRREDFLSFYQVIVNCPHLVKLQISRSQLYISDSAISITDSNNNTKFISKLNTLVIENSQFDENLFTAVSSLCLHVKSLSLTHCVYNGFNMHHEQPSIFLPHHSLDLCILDSIRVSRHCSIRLGTTRFSIHTQHGGICYDLMEYEWRRIGYWESINNIEQLRAKRVKMIENGIEKKAYLSVKCKNIKRLYLTGLEVMRDGYFLF